MDLPNDKFQDYRSISHFAINGLDYIITIEENGIIKLYNRRGGERYNVKQKPSSKKWGTISNCKILLYRFYFVNF